MTLFRIRFSGGVVIASEIFQSGSDWNFFFWKRDCAIFFHTNVQTFVPPGISSAWLCRVPLPPVGRFLLFPGGPCLLQQGDCASAGGCGRFSGPGVHKYLEWLCRVRMV